MPEGGVNYSAHKTQQKKWSHSRVPSPQICHSALLGTPCVGPWFVEVDVTQTM